MEVEPWFPLWVMGGWWPRAEKMDLVGEEEERKGEGGRRRGSGGGDVSGGSSREAGGSPFGKAVCVCVFNLLTSIFI